MNESEYFRRAANDASFRRAKLEDLRYFKTVGTGLVWITAVVAAGFSIYGGVIQGEWDKGLGLFVMAFVCAITNQVYSTRIAALQALDER